MQVTVEAFKSHLPTEQYTVRVQPMRLVMGSSGFLSGIMTLLNLRSVTACPMYTTRRVRQQGWGEKAGGVKGRGQAEGTGGRRGKEQNRLS